MNCAQALSYLYEYVDRHLPAPLRTEVQAHIAICRGCTRRFGIEESLRAVVGRSGRVVAEIAGLKVALRQKLAAVRGKG